MALLHSIKLFAKVESEGRMREVTEIGHYPFVTTDKIRYGDTDRQGHVNNAVFATFLETGRVELLAGKDALAEIGQSFVVARVAIDFRAEVRWPGGIEIGTRVTRIGRSSITLEQALFQDGRCVAVAESVVVLTDETTRRSHPLSERTVAWLETTIPKSARSSS